LRLGGGGGPPVAGGLGGAALLLPLELRIHEELRALRQPAQLVGEGHRLAEKKDSK